MQLLGATVTTPNTASSPLPSGTPTSTPPSSSSGSSDPSNTTTTTTTSSSGSSSSPSSSGLSTGAKAGIGAGIGGAVLIALVLLGLFLFRRRKQRSTTMHDKAVEPYKPVATPPDTTMTGTNAQAPPPHQNPQAFGRHEMYNDSEAAKYEMPAPPRAEVQGRESPAELPGAPLGRGR
jgi:LPXTG-motif cell wall-anchored protein